MTHRTATSNAARGLVACTLVALTACGGTPSGNAPPDDGSTVLTVAPIADLLTPEALERVSYDDGSLPVTEGSWYRPTLATSWTWQLQGPLNLSYEADVYGIDMFSALGRDTLARLHERGVRVLCYFSAGTYEPWRPDAGLFDEADLAEPHAGFANERWLDIGSERVVRLMVNRMDMAVRIGCDGIELDNVDAFLHRTGLDVTPAGQLRYVRTLANAAHARNLTVALKNAVALLPDAMDWFDLAINEECFEFDECELYDPLLAAGKPVFGAEFDARVVRDPAAREAMCARARELGTRTLVLPESLDGSFRYSCDE